MTTSSEKKATDAVAELVKERDDARLDLNVERKRLRDAMHRIQKLEDQLYRPMARSITGFMCSEMGRYETPYQSYRLTLRPKSFALCIPLEDLHRSVDSIAIIDEKIEGVLKMHTDDLRQQMRSNFWDNCR